MVQQLPAAQYTHWKEFTNKQHELIVINFHLQFYLLTI